MAKNNRQLSAKDKAFERERIKLNSTIQSKNHEIAELRKEVEYYKKQTEVLEEQIAILQENIGIPKEELIAKIERDKKLEQLLKVFSRI